VHCSINFFPTLLFVFLYMFSRELVGASSFDTQRANSMYLYILILLLSSLNKHVLLNYVVQRLEQ
jgi:hypothetical protein